MAVIKRVQRTNPQLLVDAFVETFRQEESAVVRDTLAVMLLVPTTQPDVLNSSCVEFVVALAAAAADKEQLNLEKFMADKLAAARTGRRTRAGCCASCTSTRPPRGTAHPPRSARAAVGGVARVVAQGVAVGPGVDGHGRGRGGEAGGGAVLQALSGDGGRGDGVGRGGGCCGWGRRGGRRGPGHSDGIEELANAYFQKIYTSEQSIAEVMEMLKRFKNTKDSKEQEIFSCMIRNLFDEYRFFHKYPEKELRITGILFGSLIQHQLVTSLTLGVALRYVLEALRRPPGTGNAGKWFRFGMFALEQFKGRLHEWPQYCCHIIQIPHLRQNQPELVLEIERAMTRQPEQLLLPNDLAAGLSARPQVGPRPSPSSPSSSSSSTWAWATSCGTRASSRRTWSPTSWVGTPPRP